MSITLSEKVEVKVRFNEADSLGIVWHGHYIQYFEDGREAFGQKYGLGYLDCYEKGFSLPLISVQCDYKKPLRFGDNVIVEIVYVPSDAAKLKFKYRLTNAQTGDVVATGSTVQVFLSRENFELFLTNPPYFEEWKIKNQVGQ